MPFSKYIAEFVATFALTLGVSLSLIHTDTFPLATPLVAALTVGIMVYCIGKFSLAQINPAVTIALAVAKKIKISEVVPYIISQIAGALVAMVLVQWLTGTSVSIASGDSMQIGIGEALGAFFLMFGISAVAMGTVHEAAAGVVIGSSLLMGILVAMNFSNGILNPAVAIGLGSVSATYLLAPIAGALAGLGVYGYIQSPEKQPKKKK